MSWRAVFEKIADFSRQKGNAIDLVDLDLNGALRAVLLRVRAGWSEHGVLLARLSPVCRWRGSLSAHLQSLCCECHLFISPDTPWNVLQDPTGTNQPHVRLVYILSIDFVMIRGEGY